MNECVQCGRKFVVIGGKPFSVLCSICMRKSALTDTQEEQTKTGWRCPVCKKGCAPFVSACPHCEKSKKPVSEKIVYEDNPVPQTPLKIPFTETSVSIIPDDPVWWLKHKVVFAT